MVENWEYVPTEETDLTGSLLVMGMPSVGMVGLVAAGFLIDRLGMRLIGGFQSDGMPPVAAIRDGIVTSPVQLWSTELTCGLDGRCDRLLVLKGDVSLPVEQIVPFATSITSWAIRANLGLIVGLEGYPSDAPQADTGTLVAASTAAFDMLPKLEANKVGALLMTGFNAVLLMRANREKLPAVGLFAPVSLESGDAKAAARVLRIIDPLVPNIRLAPEELERQAGVIEAQLKGTQEEAARYTRRMKDQVDRGYA